MKLFRKIKGKLGFTLAEMLIVVAILAILTAVAAPNVAKYSRSINLRELNDSARAIYMAAEHKFMNEIEMGNELPGLDDGAAKITEPLPRYDETSEVDIFYLKSNDSGSPLKKLMSSGGTDVESTGVVESQLFDNNFIVEYNPKTGDVYGVFYSEKENFDDYTTNFYSDVADVQSKKLIGYYGLMNEKPDAHPVVQEIEKPTVEVINKEKLVVKINTESTENQYVTISVNGKEIIKRNNTYMNGSVEIILDSLTPGTPGIPGKANLPSENGQLQPKYEDTIANWLDETGLTIDGSDMTLTVTFYDKDGIARDQSVTKTFNPLFANGSTSDTAYIEYGRHLQNLDKCSTIQTAVIKKTINFASTAGNYEGWANAEIYQGRKFSALNIYSSIHLSANAGVEIQNMDAKGGGLMYFGCLGTTIEQLTFRNCTIAGDEYAGQAGTVGAFFTGNIKLSNVTVINPTIIGSTSGGLIGSAEEITIDNCKVYVEAGSEETWEDPANDPYYSSDVSGTGMAGGLVGRAQAVIITNSYSAVKVESTSGASGGLIGDAEKDTVIEKSFAAGHTYKGTFEGKLDDGTEFSLKDNVKGATAGGIVGSCNDGTLKLSGTVFSTCSVSGTTVDPAYNGTAVTDGATVYTLGTAYKDNGGGTFEEIKKSADANVKTGDEVKDDASTAVGKRYDLKVSSVYKYPVRDDMTMHGDWPSSDAVTGFFYWEKHGEDYNFHILCDDCHEKEYENLCKKQDGSNITAYGYGAFSVGGSLDSAVTFCDGTDDVTIDEREEDAEKTVEAVTEAIQKALAGVPDLKITDSSTVAVKLYNVTGVSGTGFVTATVGGNNYTFAPDFYAISADKGSDHAGTDANVFGVRCKNHLQNVANALSGSFKQSHDINYKADTTGLTPIGNSTNKFAGAYDGGSYRIIDAKFNTTEGSDYAGLFAVTDNATLENIVLFNEAATADEFDKNKIEGKTVGVIVGNAENAGKITNCVAAGYTVIGSENSGGIAGISACPITNCEANIKFGKVQNVAGGIVGNGENSEITNCYALVHGIESPKSSMTLGGIAGKAKTVKDCYVIFAGQTIGNPVANVGDDASNYFVYDVGYCSVGGDSANGGNKVLLKKSEGSTEPLLSDKKPADSAQISYTETAAKHDDTNKYDYTAVVTDNVAGHPVHYGPIPEATSGALAIGPIVGIYSFLSYSYNKFDGYLGYNKNGVLYFSESKNLNVSEMHGNGEFVGVFIEPEYEDKTIDIYDSRIEIRVDGEIIKKENIVEFEEYYGVKGEPWLQQGAYFFDSKYGNPNDPESTPGERDHFTQKGTAVNDTIKDRFKYYVLLNDDGTKINLNEKHLLQILFEPDGLGKGVLVEAYNDHLTTINNLKYAASLADSGYDMSDLPSVGAFLVSRYDNSNPTKYDPTLPYYIKATIGNNSLGGELPNWTQAYSRIGILIKNEDVAEFTSRRLNIVLDKLYVKLEKWDDVMQGATIANFDEVLGEYKDDYTLFVVTDDRATGNYIESKNDYTKVTNLSWVFDFIYGTERYLSYMNNVGSGFKIKDNIVKNQEYIKASD